MTSYIETRENELKNAITIAEQKLEIEEQKIQIAQQQIEIEQLKRQIAQQKEKYYILLKEIAQNIDEKGKLNQTTIQKLLTIINKI